MYILCLSFYFRPVEKKKARLPRKCTIAVEAWRPRKLTEEKEGKKTHFLNVQKIPAKQRVGPYLFNMWHGHVTIVNFQEGFNFQTWHCSLTLCIILYDRLDAFGNFILLSGIQHNNISIINNDLLDTRAHTHIYNNIKLPIYGYLNIKTFSPIVSSYTRTW